jgi:hypothetical protein
MTAAVVVVCMYAYIQRSSCWFNCRRIDPMATPCNSLHMVSSCELGVPVFVALLAVIIVQASPLWSMLSTGGSTPIADAVVTTVLLAVHISCCSDELQQH